MPSARRGAWGFRGGTLRPAASHCPEPPPPARSVFIGAAAPPSALCNNTAITCGKRGAGGKQKPGQQPGGGGGRRVGLGELPPFNLSLFFFFFPFHPLPSSSSSSSSFSLPGCVGAGGSGGRWSLCPWYTAHGSRRLAPAGPEPGAAARLGSARPRPLEWHRAAAVPWEVARLLPRCFCREGASAPGQALAPRRPGAERRGPPEMRLAAGGASPLAAKPGLSQLA